jgi:glyoxylase-like metal-dependent hydrolase (beta-lactamase superfamily II)
MRIAFLTLLLLACGAPALAQTTPPQPPAAQAPAPAPPASPFTTIKVDGTDNIFIFRYQGYQAMFVVTPEGVIVTDPIGYLRPQAVKTYLDEIRKITSAPIKYVVYSHHHFDHIAGGRPFKDLGATFIAQRRAKEHLEALQYADAVIPDEVVDDRRTLTLGGTELELSYVGRNHSDNSLVMRLPKEKLLFAVDFIPIESVNFRNMPDSWPIEWEDSLKKVLAMDWDRLIPGHPYKGRLGTKEDVKNLFAFMQELSAEVKQAAEQGKCADTAMKEVKLEKYQTWLSYGQYLAGNIERYCYWWGRGY